MTILIFTEGTVLMHASAQGKTRGEIVAQNKNPVKRLLGGISDYANYIPIGNAPEKIKKWCGQGATIFYLTSRRSKNEIEAIKNVLQKYNFPDNKNFLFRQQGEDYKQVAEKLMPDILIEDDCESIGGEKEMTYPNMSPEAKTKVHSVPVKEFGGIGHLPDETMELKY